MEAYMVFQQYPMIEYLEDLDKPDEEDEVCEPQVLLLVFLESGVHVWSLS